MSHILSRNVYYVFILFLFQNFIVHSNTQVGIIDDYFEEGASDNLELLSDDAFSDLRKSSRDDEADVEVILNPGPMIAPDIIIRQFVDPKPTIDKMMEDLLKAKKKTQADANNEIDTDGDHENGDEEILNDMPFSDYSSENEIDDDDQRQDDFTPPLKVFSGNEPCRMKFNGTSGQFSMNFTRNCLVLLTTPEKKSTLVLNCSPVVLGNCSVSRDTLTVNLKGDMRFGRNSYVYCGPNAQVRATSLRRRISIKIRKAADIKGTTECKFHTRKRRDLSIPSLNGVNTPGELDVGLPTTASCGRLGRMSKIVGGRRVSPGLFPWVAQLDITRTDGTQTACTGSLVSSNYILTAAHCLKNAESISVFMGGTDRHEFTGSEITVQAEKYILHRKWSARTLTADIALVKLTDAVKFTEDVSPICLPKGKLQQENFEGRKAVAVGWGRVESKTKAPRQLYRVRLPFLDEQLCQRIYRRFFVPRIMVCTDSTVNAAICYGDSGGPLMYKRQERVYQVGVASFSLSKTCGASPDVFTHVREYVPWIESRIYQDA